MGNVLYSRSFYQLDKQTAMDIVNQLKTRDSLLPNPEFPPNHPWPVPNIATESAFLMVLMQGYLSSPAVSSEMKHGLLDIYEKLVDLSVEDKEEKESIKVKGQLMIQSSERIRSVILEAIDFKKIDESEDAKADEE